MEGDEKKYKKVNGGETRQAVKEERLREKLKTLRRS